MLSVFLYGMPGIVKFLPVLYLHPPRGSKVRHVARAPRQTENMVRLKHEERPLDRCTDAEKTRRYRRRGAAGPHVRYAHLPDRKQTCLGLKMHKTPEITRLIHDNFWIVLSFAFGQPAVGNFIEKKFAGEWKYLHKAVYEHAEIRADRALLEMATQLRVLDDAEDMNEYFKQVKRPPLGEVIQAGGTRTDMHFRDMTNKVMHGTRFEWRLGTDDPKIVVHSNQPDRWQSAEISIFHLMGLIGGLMF
jgi:hypothetical protein